MVLKCMFLIVMALGMAILGTTDSRTEEIHFDEKLMKEMFKQNKHLKEKLTQLESDMNMLKDSLVTQESTNNDQTRTITRLEKKLNSFGRLSEETKHSDNQEGKGKTQQPLAVKRQEAEHVAFSAYVDHEVLHMGTDQIVQFQNVLLNDGNGYNKFTGIFTVPTGGVYLLAFFVEDYHRFQSIFHMVVDRSIVTSAIADPLPENQNVQGGNVIITRLQAGNSVWVTTGTAGDNIEGYGALRTSTFSGYLLYQ